MVLVPAFRIRNRLRGVLYIPRETILPPAPGATDFVLHITTQGLLGTETNKAIQGFDDDTTFDPRWIP